MAGKSKQVQKRVAARVSELVLYPHGASYFRHRTQLQVGGDAGQSRAVAIEGYLPAQSWRRTLLRVLGEEFEISEFPAVSVRPEGADRAQRLSAGTLDARLRGMEELSLLMVLELARRGIAGSVGDPAASAFYQALSRAVNAELARRKGGRPRARYVLGARP